MERNSICVIASAALWATIPSLGISKDSLFSLHDPRDGTADQLIAAMNIPLVGQLALEDHDELICGPLSPDQAAVLSAATAVAGLGLNVIQPAPSEVLNVDYADGGEAVVAAAEAEMGAAHEPLDAVSNFIGALSDQLGVPVTVVDGVIEAGEPCCPAAATAKQLADGGVEPDDFICLTARELTSVIGGNPVAIQLTSDGFYMSDAVLAEVDAAGLEQKVEAVLAEDAAPASASPFTEREDILLDAAETVGTLRNNQYGEPEDSLAGIAAYWGVYFGADFSPKDVAIMMALLKVARAENGYVRDNYVDAAGYMALAGEAELNAVTTPERTVH